MHQSKRILSLLNIFVFLFGQVLTSNASAQLRINPLALGDRGVSIETVPVRDCNSDGTNCHASSGQRPFNTVQTLIQVDGHYFAAEAVVDQNRDKFLYLGASFANRAGSSDMMDPKTARSFQFLETSETLDDIQKNLPNLAQGIANIATMLQMTQQLHDQLKGAYNESLNQLGRVGKSIENRADAANEIAKFNQGLVGSVLGGAASRVQDPRISAQYSKYLDAFNDPWSTKKYSLSADALKQVQDEYNKAIAENDFYTATDAARILLNQADESLSRQAAAGMRKHFSNGILNTESFGSSQKSPLDGIRLYTSTKAPYGQAIRHVANKSQKLWLSSNGLQYSSSTESQAYVMGNAALRAADESFAAGKTELGIGLLSVAEAMIDLGSGISRGMLNNLSQTAEAVPFLASAIKNFSKQAITDPVTAAATAGRFLRGIPGLAEAIAMDYVAKVNRLKDGNAYERGEVIGEIAGELITNWITEGTISAVKGAAKAGVVAVKSTRATKIAAQMSEKAIARAKNIATHFPGPRGAGLIKIAQKDTIAAVEAMNTVEQLAYNGQKDAAEFIGRAVSAESDYIMTRGGAKRVAEVYESINSKMGSAPIAKFEGTVSRGIEKTATLSDGRVIKNTLKDVFETHDGMIKANGRYSIGGSEGQIALYTTIGEGESVNSLITSELRKSSSDEILFQSRNISFAKGLDLSDPMTLNHLGLTSKSILMSDQYLTTQIIGDIAKKNGLEFIIAPSAVNPKLRNLIIIR